MVDASTIFRYPVRSADVWGLNDSDGLKRSEEDIAADLDFQDNAVEDYLSNTVPNLYIQQSSFGSGYIDPNQLASGTPGSGKAPVGNPPVWTDIATQSELDAHINDTTDAHAASAITFTPYSTIASITVQSAIQELIDETSAGVTYTTPAIVLGTAAVAGASATAIRSDSTIVAFDATSPSTQAIGDAAAVGVAAKAARRDHKHAMPSFSTNAVVLGTAAAAGVATTLMRSDDTILAFDATSPSTQAFGDSAVVGVATVAARRDHKHAWPSFATPSIGLGTAAAAGAATTPIRSDATILAFDATVPVTQAIGDSAAVGAATVAARRDHTHGMPAFATNAVVLSTAAAAGAATTLMRSDATIAAFDATAPTTSQIADVSAAGSANFAARRDHVHGREDLDQSNLAPSANETIAANYSAVVVGQYTIASGVLITIASGGVLAIL